MSRSLSAARSGAGNTHPIPAGTRRMAEMRQQALVMMLGLSAALLAIPCSAIFYLVVRSWPLA